MSLGDRGATVIEGMLHSFRIRYEAPFDWRATLAFYRARAIIGVEHVSEDAYFRSVAFDDLCGSLAVQDDPRARTLIVRCDPGLRPAAVLIEERLIRMFDLDADLDAIRQHFDGDPAMGAWVAARPWVRVLGHWDPFETAVRAVLGQQVTLRAARGLAARLVMRAGRPFSGAGRGNVGRLFPRPGDILAADLSRMGMPGARVRALINLAEAALADPTLFARSASLDETVSRFQAIKGLGPWTAHYIALRACREPDAFPASDVGLLRGMAHGGERPLPTTLAMRAEVWRPYRAYAAHHIWAALDAMLPAGDPVRNAVDGLRPVPSGATPAA